MFQTAKNIIVFVFAATLALNVFACRQATAPVDNTAANTAPVSANAGTPANSPTEAYKMLFAAVRAKDSAGIERMMSKATLGMAGGAAKQFGVTLEKQLRNGMLETTITDTLPEMRDERVRDNYGAIEVYNKKTGGWDETFFIKEDGGWKMAAGEMFAGSYKSPGKSRSQVEAEASNSAGNNMVEIKPNINGAAAPAAGKIPHDGNVKTAEIPLERPSKKSAEAGKGNQQ